MDRVIKNYEDVDSWKSGYVLIPVGIKRSRNKTGDIE